MSSSCAYRAAPVRVELSNDGVLQITLARPPTNALDLPTVEALVAAAPAIDTARVVVLQGEGPNFCAGGDVRAFAAAADREELVLRVAETTHRFCQALAVTDVPVVAAVRGWAVGAGLSFLLACDVVVACRTARFASAYGRIGFTPDGGMSALLPQRIGPVAARDLLLTGRTIDADEAVALGLVSRLVDGDQVAATTEEIVVALARGPHRALTATKRLIREAGERDLVAHMDAEAKCVARQAVHAEGREGVDAFVEKRRPAWRALPPMRQQPGGSRQVE